MPPIKSLIKAKSKSDNSISTQNEWKPLPIPKGPRTHNDLLKTGMHLNVRNRSLPSKGLQ